VLGRKPGYKRPRQKIGEATLQQHKFKLAAAAIAIGLVSFAAGTFAQGRYGEINAAIGSLNGALGQLQRARDVFGGHKMAAEQMIREAIRELEAGKADAAAHGR
jgi:hypothetical protein